MYLGIVDLEYLDRNNKVEWETINNRLQIMQTTNLMPGAPLLKDDDWKQLRDYYMRNAPEKTIVHSSKLEIQEDSQWFIPRPNGYKAQQAISTLVKIDAERQEILISDYISKKITTLDKQLEVSNELMMPDDVVIVANRMNGNEMDLLSIGDLSGSAVGRATGAVFKTSRSGSQWTPKGVTLFDLYRPSSMDFGDLTQDGREEIVVTNFGIEAGNVAIHQKVPTGERFDPKPIKVLLTDTGAVDCQIFDFDKDGRLDIMTMTSNARENISIHYNRGDLNFERKVVVEWPPTNGAVSFEILDFDKDGLEDLITVCGDNGDTDPYNTLKYNHGVRIFLNQGDGQFKESYFHPMYGAYGAKARDFDLDGDLDLAINAFHPDFNSNPLENFVILKQTSPMQFEATTHPATYKGRWLTMDTGDLDQDGDEDIVLAAGYITTGLMYDNEELLKEMVQNWPALLFLENKTID